MGETRYKGLQTCPHCDGAICPNFKKVSLTPIGCDLCVNLINSMNEA